MSLAIEDPKSGKRFIALAAKKLETIRLEMEFGTFRYGDHFPDSPYAEQFGEGNRSNRTLKAALEEWLADHDGTVENSTFVPNRRIVTYTLIPMVGEQLVDSFKASHAVQLVKDLAAKGIVAKTVRNILWPLRVAFDREMTKGIIEVNPMRQIRISQHLPVEAKKHRVPKPRPFDDAERAALLRVANDQMRNMLQFWWMTGLSAGEILGVEWTDCNFVNGTITLQRVMDTQGKLRPRMKTEGRHRDVEMTDEVRAVLADQKRFTFLETGGPIFVNPITGTRWTRSKALTHNQWPTLLKRAGVDHRGPNQFRHTYAAIRIMRRDNLWEIANALGHRSPEMLYKHYGSIIKKVEDQDRKGEARGRKAE